LQIDLSLAWIEAVVLCSLRIAPALALAPVFGGTRLPARIRALLLMLLAMSFAPVPGDGAGAMQGSAFIGAVLAEVLYGWTLAFGWMAAFAAIDFAGRLIDAQIGFSMASTFDPAGTKPSPLFTSALGLLATTLFFTADLHHILLRELAQSIAEVPLGQAPHTLPLEELLRRFGGLFAHGLALAAPLVFLLFLVDVVLAVMSRSVPQLNVLLMGVAVKIAIGLLVAVALSGHWVGAIVRELASAAR
jgi:flagellar biosynthesis protein FliR